jgi:hypothetical protein
MITVGYKGEKCYRSVQFIAGNNKNTSYNQEDADDDPLKIEMHMSKYKNKLQLLRCISQRLVGEINNFTVYLKCVNKTFSKFQTFIWQISYSDQF